MEKQLIDRRYSGVLIALFCADLIALPVGWFLSYVIRFYILETENSIPDFYGYLNTGFILILLAIVFLPNSKNYSSKSLIRTRFAIIPVITGLFFIFGGLSVFLFFYREQSLSRISFLIAAVLSLFFMLFARLCLKFILTRLHRKGRLMKKALIIGNQKSAEKFAERIEKNPQLGLRMIGYIGRAENPKMANYLGNYEKLESTLKINAIDQVYIALSVEEQSDLKTINRILDLHTADLFLVPDVYSSLNICPEVFSLEDSVVFSLRQSPLIGINVYMKRACDILLSLFFILLFSPFFILIPILIKLTSRGPIIYSQERMGLDGQTFHIHKFRSMKVDAEVQTGAVWAKPEDNRKTPLGNFLRKTSLDEIPQFFNVLKGEMSIVGPRPERPVFVEQFSREIPSYMLRHKMKAGITGWAQVNGFRGNTSLEKRLEADLFYLTHWSLVLDFKIILLTAFRMFSDENAY